ncbi:MAG: type IV pilus modification protein PilV [Nitrospinae bacterium]|nr:type IV pilus modification protein PilV [Nitrospinota bacterium]
MSNKQNEMGFTLIEVLIAIVILSIALLGLSSMNLYTIQGNNLARQETAAVALAQDKIEELKNKTFVDSAVNDSNATNNTDYTTLKNATSYPSCQLLTCVDQQDANNPIDEKGNSGGVYTRIWNIANYGAGTVNPYPNTKLIVVIVTWTDSSGSHSVTLTTMKGCKEFDAAGTCIG